MPRIDELNLERASEHLAKRYPDPSTREQLVKTARLANLLATNLDNFHGFTDWATRIRKDIARLQRTLQLAPRLDLHALTYPIVDRTLGFDPFKNIKEAATSVDAATVSLAALKIPSEMLHTVASMVRRGRFRNPRILFAAAANMTLARKTGTRPSRTDLLAAAMLAGIEPPRVIDPEAKRDHWKKALDAAGELLKSTEGAALPARFVGVLLSFAAAVWQLYDNEGPQALEALKHGHEALPISLLLECVPARSNEARILHQIRAAGRAVIPMNDLLSAFGIEDILDKEHASKASPKTTSPQAKGE
jgi:hypothetical protein